MVMVVGDNVGETLWAITYGQTYIYLCSHVARCTSHTQLPISTLTQFPCCTAYSAMKLRLWRGRDGSTTLEQTFVLVVQKQVMCWL